MDHHLTQEAAEPDRNQANHRNGYSKKTVLTDAAKIEIAVPRDRAGTFDPQLIAKYQRRIRRRPLARRLLRVAYNRENICYSIH